MKSRRDEIVATAFPRADIVADDLDEDGKIDLWLGGNFYALKPQVGRHDASRGIFLKGTSGRSVIVQPPVRSGNYVEEEMQVVAIIRSKDNRRLVSAGNNAKGLVFQT